MDSSPGVAPERRSRPPETIRRCGRLLLYPKPRLRLVEIERPRFPIPELASDTDPLPMVELTRAERAYRPIVVIETRRGAPPGGVADLDPADLLAKTRGLLFKNQPDQAQAQALLARWRDTRLATQGR